MTPTSTTTDTWPRIFVADEPLEGLDHLVITNYVVVESAWIDEEIHGRPLQECWRQAFVILSGAKDLKLRNLRSFAVFAAQDDVEARQLQRR